MHIAKNSDVSVCDNTVHLYHILRCSVLIYFSFIDSKFN
jgi:hypothetical protein